MSLLFVCLEKTKTHCFYNEKKDKNWLPKRFFRQFASFLGVNILFFVCFFKIL